MTDPSYFCFICIFYLNKRVVVTITVSARKANFKLYVVMERVEGKICPHIILSIFWLYELHINLGR